MLNSVKETKRIKLLLRVMTGELESLVLFDQRFPCSTPDYVLHAPMAPPTVVLTYALLQI